MSVEPSLADVVGQLVRSRQLGFLGPGELDVPVAHARAMAGALPSSFTRAVDLGAGGGLPGLVLAALRPDAEWVFLDSNVRRTDFLREAVEALGWVSRVEVVCGRAEEVAHRPEVRHRADLVVARSFAPPATTAECAAPLLRVGGTLVVSEPPEGGTERWPASGLALLGLGACTDVEVDGYHFARMTQVEPCPSRFPRRVGVPAKRPLFGS